MIYYGRRLNDRKYVKSRPNVVFFLITGGIKTQTANNARGKIYVKEEDSVNKTELVTSVAEKSGMTRRMRKKH